MCFSWDAWLNNFDVLESLLEFLRVRDVVVLASCSKDCREVLGREKVWGRLARRREGSNVKEEYLAKEYGEYAKEARKSGLEPLCRSFFVTVYPPFVRRRWRNGSKRQRYMDVPQDLRKDVIVCYDVCQEFVVLGTMFGRIVAWRFFRRVDDLQMFSGCLDQRIDKLSIRHGMIVAVQNGLIMVFSEQQGCFALLYCKSFETPHKALLLGKNSPNTLADKYSVPDMPRDQFQLRYKPLKPAKYPDQDFTISTTGREVFASVRVGEKDVTVHCLQNGSMIHSFSMSHDLKVMKLAIVHLEQFNSLLYVLAWTGEDKFALKGMFYSLNTKQYISQIQLHQQFDCMAGFFSLFTEYGLLMIGKKVEESDPLTFTLTCWNYAGEKVYSFSLYFEFGLCLAECRYGALVTPRALNYIHHTSDKIIISRKTYIGASVTCYSWPGESSHVWKVNSSLEVCCSRSNILLAGSQAGSIVCTAAGARNIVVREEGTGTKIFEETVQGEIENMWVGDFIIVTVPKNFKHGNNVCLVHIC